MPDDIIEVTEQEPQEAVDAFMEEETEEAPEVTEETPEEESEKPEKDTDGEAEEEPESEEDAEQDEDLERGKELLAEKKRREEEQAEAQRKAEAEARQAEERSAASRPVDADTLKVFNEFVKPDLFPEEAIEVDGIPFDVRQYLTDVPEAGVVSGLIAKSIVDRLLQNGYLVGGTAIEELRKEFSNQRFLDKVTDPTYGVPKAPEIYKSEDFQKWQEKQPDEIKALFTSEDWQDHVKGFKRFLNATGKAKAESKAKEIDEKRKKAKEKADAIYSSTGKNRKTPKAGEAVEGQEAAMAAFLEDDD